MKKSTLIAIVVFAGLLVAALVLTKQDKPERGITRISFANVKLDDVMRVEITGEKPIKLHRDGDTWKLDNNKEADAAAVKRMLEAIPKIATSHLVTRNKDRFADLQVDDAKGLGVKVYDKADKVLADFVIGKSGAETNVRIKNDVYGAKGLSRYLFARDRSAWHQLKLFKTGLADVESVDVQIRDAKPYSLIKSGEDWALKDASVVPADFRFDKSVAKSLVSSLVGLRAQSIEEKDPGVEKTGLDDNADKLSFSAKNDIKGTILLGKKNDDNKVYAKLQGGDSIYLLAQFTARNITKKATDLRDLSFIKLDTSKVNKLEIRKDKELVVLEKKDGTWSISKAKPKASDDYKFDPSAVDARLASLAKARAFRVFEDNETTAKGISKSSASIVASLDDKSKVELKFGDELQDDKRKLVYAHGNIDNAIYGVTGYLRDSLTKGLEGFKKRPPMPAGRPGAMGGMGGGMGGLDPSSLSKLPPEVRKQLMQQMAQQQQKQRMMQQIQAQAAEKKPAAQETK